MAIQILPELGLGERLGSSFGTGLGSGLQALLQNRLNSQQNMRGLQALQFSPQEAQALSMLDSSLLAPIIKQKLQQPAQESYANALASILGIPTQESRPLDQLNQAVQPQVGQPVTTKMATLSFSSPVPSLKGLTEKQATDLARLSTQQRKLQLQEEASKRREEADVRKEKRIIQQDIDKETLPYYKEVSDAASAAKNNDKRLDIQEKLIASGKLNSPQWAAAIKTLSKGVFGLGIDLSGLLLSNETQVFDKISNDFLKEARNVFGSRLTNYDVETFLKTVPTSLQSDVAKESVIKVLRNFNKAAEIKKQAMDEVIKENKGKRPRNLDVLVEEKSGPALDVLAKDIKTFEVPYEKNIREQNRESLENALSYVGNLFK